MITTPEAYAWMKGKWRKKLNDGKEESAIIRKSWKTFLQSIGNCMIGWIRIHPKLSRNSTGIPNLRTNCSMSLRVPEDRRSWICLFWRPMSRETHAGFLNNPDFHSTDPDSKMILTGKKFSSNQIFLFSIHARFAYIAYKVMNYPNIALLIHF